ncbi:MAG TPA: outer membrane beta-barrel protein [Chitinophagaceae bacterium]|nr:outer membrane beta-barrel protein [Chitinophagaceae bacterium]
MYHLLRFKKQQQSGIVALFLLLASSLTSSAQLRDGINMPDEDDKDYHIGIVVMGVSARFQISQHPQFLQSDTVLGVYPQNTFGIGIGGMHTFKISSHWDARVVFPQLLFANKVITYNLKYPETGESTITNKTIESILFGIPVQVKYKSDRINNFRVYMMAGAKWETDLSSKARSKNADDLVKLKANDFGIEAGVGFNFYMRYFILSPEIKISNGLNNVHSRDPNLKFSNVIDKIQSRQIIFSLIFEG